MDKTELMEKLKRIIEAKKQTQPDPEKVKEFADKLREMAAKAGK